MERKEPDGLYFSKPVFLQLSLLPLYPGISKVSWRKGEVTVDRGLFLGSKQLCP
jgi:hypothetical protein